MKKEQVEEILRSRNVPDFKVETATHFWIKNLEIEIRENGAFHINEHYANGDVSAAVIGTCYVLEQDAVGSVRRNLEGVPGGFFSSVVLPALRCIESERCSQLPRTKEQSSPEPSHRYFPAWLQICCILSNHKVNQSRQEAENTCITEDGFIRIYASDLVIVIQPEEEVMHISTLDPPKTFTHDLCEWDEMSVLEFPAPDLDYILWTDHLKRALFEIIDVLDPRQDAGMDEDRIPDDSDGSLPPNPNDYPPNNGEPTYDQLKKRVQKLEGRLSVIQKDNDDLLKACKQLRESNKKKSERIEELSEIADGYYKRLELYQWAFEDYLSTIRESRKGVTSDS